MLERDKYKFYDTESLFDTPGIHARANAGYMFDALKQRLGGDSVDGCRFDVISVTVNDTGGYKKIQGLPSFVDVRLSVWCGKAYRPEKIIIWSPLAWNDRFAGTAGGGSGIGGEEYIKKPDNTTRGWTLPYALVNGFTAATADGGNVTGRTDYVLDEKTGAFDRDLYENWRRRATHHMAVFGKAVAEILHNRPVKYSYMNGGSGGGRQSLTSAQEYPEDFNGIWAACPAINWNKFLMVSLWDIAVMNDMHHVISPKRLKAISQAARDAVGGDEAYFHMESQPYFDPYSAVGRDGITKEDAAVAKALWEGPRTRDGVRLWYGFRPGVVFWFTGLPIGAFYYKLFSHKPGLFVVCPQYYNWITKDPSKKYEDSSIDDFYDLFDKSVNDLSDAACDKPDLSVFAAHGGKLMIDHGLNDPLIPVDGTIDYYKRMQEAMGADRVDEFVRLYINPGDGHGHCFGDAPGITEAAGMAALIDWVERGVAPGELRAVRTGRSSGELLEEGVRGPVTDIAHYEVRRNGD